MTGTILEMEGDHLVARVRKLAFGVVLTGGGDCAPGRMTWLTTVVVRLVKILTGPTIVISLGYLMVRARGGLVL